jgi:hypothetical protein
LKHIYGKMITIETVHNGNVGMLCAKRNGILPVYSATHLTTQINNGKRNMNTLSIIKVTNTVSPWTWEFQFDSYFDKLGLYWRECAADREVWQHRKGWIEHRLGRRNTLL